MTRAEYAAWKVFRGDMVDPEVKVDRIYAERAEQRLVVELQTNCGVSMDALLLLARSLKTMAITVEPQPMAYAGELDSAACLHVIAHRVPPEMFNKDP